MIRTVKPALTVLMFVFACGQAYGQTAAETDYIPRDSLSQHQLGDTPWFCNGIYLQPLDFDQGRVRRGKGPIDAAALSAEHQDGSGTTLEGDIELLQGNSLLRARRAILDANHENVALEGPVQLREPGLLIMGEKARANLPSGSGEIDEATFLLHGASVRGNAEQISKLSNNDLKLTNAELTRCEPGNNLWSMKSRNIHLRPDQGFGTARDVTLRIKNVPIAYFPYLRFPVGNERQSGFLMPSAGHDSDGGTDIVIPYYFNLAPNYDATYTFRSLWKRGIVHDIEFRHMSWHTENSIQGAYLHQDDIYDDRTTFDNTTGGTTDPFEKQDRWLLNVSHLGRWGNQGRWTSEVDYSAVSDIDYLRDIGGDVGSTAYQDQDFSRTLGERVRTPALKRTGAVSYLADDFTAYMKLQEFQVMSRTANEQYKKLPEFSLAHSKQWSLLEFNNKLRYTYFDRETEGLGNRASITGSRSFLESSVESPIRSLWGYATPKFQVLHRQYDLDVTSNQFRTQPSVTTPSFSLDTGLIFDRYFRVSNTSLLQTLEPRLYYLYSEFDDQSDLPNFDSSSSNTSLSRLFRMNRFSGYDRVGDTEQLSIALTSRFFLEETGAEILSLQFGQALYFGDQEVGGGNTPGSSALFGSLTASLDEKLIFNASLEWEPRDGLTNRGKLSLKYHADDRRIFNLNYSYVSPDVRRSNIESGRFEEESTASFIWPLYKQWSAFGMWNFGWDNNQTIESLAGVEYNDCCWKVRIAFRRFIEAPRELQVIVDDPTSPSGVRRETRLDRQADTGIFFEFQLKGLSSLGGRLDGLLEDTIPGYRSRENRIAN